MKRKGISFYQEFFIRVVTVGTSSRFWNGGFNQKKNRFHFVLYFYESIKGNHIQK